MSLLNYEYVPASLRYIYTYICIHNMMPFVLNWDLYLPNFIQGIQIKRKVESFGLLSRLRLSSLIVKYSIIKPLQLDLR